MHNVETMFSVREVPWHGLGRVIEEAPSSEEALKLAGLDWEVLPRPVMVNGTVVPGYQANVRSTNGQVLGITSDSYKIVQNREAFAFTDMLLGDGVRYETAGSLANGQRVWMSARLPRTLILDDEIDPFLVFTNSHNGKGAVKVCVTPVRVVCQNTLNLALQNANRAWTTIHMGNMEDKLEEAKRTLGFAQEYINQFKKYALTLVKTKVTDQTVTEFIEELLPIPEDAGLKRQDNIETLRADLRARYYDAPDLKKYRGTAWALVNAVSDFATHVTPLRKSPTYKERLFERTIDGHPIIDKALQLLKAA